MRVKVAQTRKEYLPLDAESCADLNNLRYLLKLRAQSVVGRENSLQRRNRLDGIGQRLRIRVRIGRDGIVGLHQ